MTSRNLPNEPEAWDDDFSLGYLEKLYGALKRDFVPTLLGDAAKPAEAGRRRAFIRHDLDVSIEHAVPLAEIEASWGVRSTYHVMIDSPFYDPRTARSRSLLAQIAELGHEIGLHYDVVSRGMKEADASARERDIDAAARELEGILGYETRSLSFHLPVPELIKGPLRVAGRVSGYGKELLEWYLSDSRARWREGEPLLSLAKPRSETLQILVHPIWWGAAHEHPAKRLRSFLVAFAAETGRRFEELRDEMWRHIIYDAADLDDRGHA